MRYLEEIINWEDTFKENITNNNIALNYVQTKAFNNIFLPRITRAFEDAKKKNVFLKYQKSHYSLFEDYDIMNLHLEWVLPPEEYWDNIADRFVPGWSESRADILFDDLFCEEFVYVKIIDPKDNEHVLEIPEFWFYEDKTYLTKFKKISNFVKEDTQKRIKEIEEILTSKKPKLEAELKHLKNISLLDDDEL